MGPGYLPQMAVKYRMQIVEFVVKLLWTQNIHTLILTTNMLSVYVLCEFKSVLAILFCATPELPSKWQYLNQLKSLHNFISTLSGFQIRKNWLFFGLLSHNDQEFPQFIVHTGAGAGAIGLETRVIIKIESYPFYPINFDRFSFLVFFCLC